jgi:hypothetical protein
MTLRIIFLTLFGAGILFGGATQAVSQNVTATATPSKVKPNIGEVITVSITIDVSATTHMLGSFTGTLNWNPSLLNYQTNSGLQAGYTGAVNDANASAGQLVFNGAKPSGTGGTINVLNITFRFDGPSDVTLNLAFSAMSAALTFTDLLPVLVVNNGLIVNVENQQSIELPKSYQLFQPFPNPFNPETVIRYALPKRSHAVLKIFNMSGQELFTLVDDTKEAGYHELKWSGQQVPSGIYFIRLQAEDYSQVQKITILR